MDLIHRDVKVAENFKDCNFLCTSENTQNKRTFYIFSLRKEFGKESKTKINSKRYQRFINNANFLNASSDSLVNNLNNTSNNTIKVNTVKNLKNVKMMMLNGVINAKNVKLV